MSAFSLLISPGVVPSPIDRTLLTLGWRFLAGVVEPLNVPLDGGDGGLLRVPLFWGPSPKIELLLSLVTSVEPLTR